MEGHRQTAYILFRSTSLPFGFSFLAQRIFVQGVADIENNTAKEMTKLAGVIQVPFRAGNQFLGEGGLQVRCACRPTHQLPLTVRPHNCSGCLLQYPRQDPHYRRPTCQSRSHYRQLNRATPTEAAR